MLKLRAGTVLEAQAAPGPEQELVVDVDGRLRPAVVDVEMLGLAEVGDEVIVNVQALDLRLGSGGFDIVHVNLTKGLSGQGREGAHVMKLCYTGMQHAVLPVEQRGEDARSVGAQDEGEDRSAISGAEEPAGGTLSRPVAVLALHGQLPALAWAFAQAAPSTRLGYVQTEGGALPGGHSRAVQALRQRGLIAGHITAGQCFGGEHEAITTAGALQHGFEALGWDAAVCGPGPGIVGSASRLGHGGLVALDSAHLCLSLGHRTLAVARMSSSDARTRHRGISHHTLTLLDLLLCPVTVALPAGMRSPVGRELRAGLGAVFGGTIAAGSQLSIDVERPARIARHDWRRAPVDLVAYAATGLPSQTMGRSIVEDPLFFGAALAAGTVLAELLQEAADE